MTGPMVPARSRAPAAPRPAQLAPDHLVHPRRRRAGPLHGPATAG
jgi:hypothetical protein